MNRKLIVNGVLILVAVMFIVGLAVQNMPGGGSLSNLFNQGPKGTPAFTVNGKQVTVEELESLKRSNPVLSSTDTGPLGDDFKTFTVARMIQQQLVAQAAGDIKVSRADVDAEVNKVREANNLKDNKAWTDALQGAGLTDSSFREQTRQSLAIQRKAEEIRKAAPTATDAEAKLYYDLNPQAFQSDARIVGREIVVTDEARAKALLAQARSGADFAKLASENSTEFKDRGGALGPLENGKPRPVAQVVLPSEVGAAAFALTTGGLTDVVKSGGKFYIVKVEAYLKPAAKPFADAKADAVTAVNEQKKAAALEAWVSGLRQNVKVEYQNPNWKVQDPTVATLEGQNIPYSDVLEQMVGNQQFTQLLQQVPAEQAAQLVNGILKPQVTEQLIQGYAAPILAKKLNLALTGPRQQQAATLAAYGARDVKVSDADVQDFYTQNKTQFQTPASGTVSEANFKDKNQALAFRTDWDGKGDFTQAAGKAGGTVSEHGAVTAGDSKLSADLNAAVFSAKTLKPAGEGSLSDVVKVGERYAVLYVTELKPAATQPLSAVRAQIETQVLGSKRTEAGQKFLTEQVATLKPVNKLKDVLAAQEKRVAAAAPKPAPTPAAPAGQDKGATPPATPATPATK